MAEAAVKKGKDGKKDDKKESKKAKKDEPTASHHHHGLHSHTKTAEQPRPT